MRRFDEPEQRLSAICQSLSRAGLDSWMACRGRSRFQPSHTVNAVEAAADVAAPCPRQWRINHAAMAAKMLPRWMACWQRSSCWRLLACGCGRRPACWPWRGRPSRCDDLVRLRDLSIEVRLCRCSRRRWVCPTNAAATQCDVADIAGAKSQVPITTRETSRRFVFKLLSDFSVHRFKSGTAFLLGLAHRIEFHMLSTWFASTHRPAGALPLISQHSFLQQCGIARFACLENLRISPAREQGARGHLSSVLGSRRPRHGLVAAPRSAQSRGKG